MAKRFPLVSSSKQLAKHLHSSVPSISIISSNTMFFSSAFPHPQGGDPVWGATESRDDIENPVIKDMTDAAKQGTRKAAEVVESVGEAAKDTVDTAWDAAKKAAQNIRETTTAEADTNVVDTVEYRCAEDLTGQLGDGCDKIEL